MLAPSKGALKVSDGNLAVGGEGFQWSYGIDGCWNSGNVRVSESEDGLSWQIRAEAARLPGSKNPSLASPRKGQEAGGWNNRNPR